MKNFWQNVLKPIITKKELILRVSGDDRLKYSNNDNKLILINTIKHRCGFSNDNTLSHSNIINKSTYLENRIHNVKIISRTDIYSNVNDNVLFTSTKKYTIDHNTRLYMLNSYNNDNESEIISISNPYSDSYKLFDSAKVLLIIVNSYDIATNKIKLNMLINNESCSINMDIDRFIHIIHKYNITEDNDIKPFYRYDGFKTLKLIKQFIEEIIEQNENSYKRFF